MENQFRTTVFKQHKVATVTATSETLYFACLTTFKILERRESTTPLGGVVLVQLLQVIFHSLC